MGTFASWGKDSFLILWHLCWQKKLATIRKQFFSLPVMFLMLVPMVLIGLSSWYIGWEGVTGIKYGLGVFVGALIFDLGIGRFFRSEFDI
jgi:hypothetical protein